VPELMMEKTSVGAISRLTRLHIHTILALMVTAGEKCQGLLNAKISGYATPCMAAGVTNTVWKIQDLLTK